MKSTLDLYQCPAPPTHCLHQMTLTETFLSLPTGFDREMLIMVIGPDHDDDDHYRFDEEHDHGADDLDDDHYTVLSSMFILYDPV